MLEHVASKRPFLRALMQRLDPIIARLWGAHIARDTVDTVRGGGFSSVRDVNLMGDVVKLIVATK